MSNPAAFVEVYGSEGDIYRISFVKGDSGIKVHCTCKAGTNGQFCRHRLALLAGDRSALVDAGATAALDEALAWPEFVSIMGEIVKLQEVQEQIETLEITKSSLKRVVARACGAKG
jgi:SWIM zinc finger